MTGFNSLLKNKTKANVLMLAIALIAIVIIMSIATDRFYQPTNVMNILTQITSLGICAAGAGIVMILGGIDLTTGNILAFTACATAALMNAGFSTGVAVLIGIILAIGCGMLNGTLIVLSRAEPFIITLGMMTVYKGFTLLVTGGKNLPAARDFTFAQDKAFDVIPIPIFCLAAVFICIFLILKYTSFGRRLYAIGNNEEAAFLSGVKIKRNKLFGYALNGGLVGLAAMISFSRLASANTIMGDSILMEALAAAVVGGVSMSGGRGSMWGVLLGTVLIGVINNALNLLAVDSFYQYIVLGAIIVGAVFISNIGSARSR